MINRLLDAAYVMFLIAASPWILYRRFAQKKPIVGWKTKLTGKLKRKHPDRPCLWFHAVSVGEVLQLQAIIPRMQTGYPQHEFVITTTTGTGFDVANTKFPNCTVQFFPFDFSWAVRRAMKSLKPKLIVLVELELWPNFLWIAQELEIPVAIINGRISDQSFKTYRRISWLTRPLLETCSVITVQNSLYAERFLDLGAAPSRLFQTGNIKFDGIETNRHNPLTSELRRCFDIRPDEFVFVAGSTQAPEETYALAAWETLRSEFPQLRLLLVPRHKERFEEVAALIQFRGHEVIRRSCKTEGENERKREGESIANLSFSLSHPHTPAPPYSHTSSVLLLDTLGELSKAWGLADMAFVGGSLTNRGGQNMMEPAGFGAAVLFGPNTWNFRDVTDALLSREAALVVENAEELTAAVRRLITDQTARNRMGEAARNFVQSQQGAAERTRSLLDRLLGGSGTAAELSHRAA